MENKKRNFNKNLNNYDEYDERKLQKIRRDDVYDIINKNNQKYRQNDFENNQNQRRIQEEYNDYNEYDDQRQNLRNYNDYNEPSARRINQNNYDEYEEYNDYNEYEEYDNYSNNSRRIEIYPTKSPKVNNQNYNYEYDEDFDDYDEHRKIRKRHPIRKFFLIVFSMLFLYCSVFGGWIAYTYLNDDSKDDYFKNGKNILSNIFTTSIPDKTTVLLTGVDKDETRTDTIMLACFDSINKKISLVSIPRDTLVKVPNDRYEIMKQNVPSLTSREMKINSVHSYGGEENGINFLKSEIEDLLNIKIDYYAKINFEGFRFLIDSIGGVQYNVQQRLYYNDKAGLVIDLQPGEQLLDGEKAEQLVRFRSGYARADLQRVEVQRDFLKAFVTQALKKENIMSNPSAYLKTIIDYVDTDFALTNAIGYLDSLEGFDTSKFNGYTLPGSSKYINGGSYYIVDEQECQKMLDEIYKDKSATSSQNPDSQENEIVEESSVGKNITILNGGYTNGLAKKAQNLLTQKGFTVSSTGNEENKIQKTEIYVSKEGLGQDLIKYFSTAENVTVNSEKCKDCDILIILGKSEKLSEE